MLSAPPPPPPPPLPGPDEENFRDGGGRFQDQYHQQNNPSYYQGQHDSGPRHERPNLGQERFPPPNRFGGPDNRHHHEQFSPNRRFPHPNESNFPSRNERFPGPPRNDNQQHPPGPMNERLPAPNHYNENDSMEIASNDGSERNLHAPHGSLRQPRPQFQHRDDYNHNNAPRQFNPRGPRPPHDQHMRPPVPGGPPRHMRPRFPHNDDQQGFSQNSNDGQPDNQQWPGPRGPRFNPRGSSDHMRGPHPPPSGDSMFRGRMPGPRGQLRPPHPGDRDPMHPHRQNESFSDDYGSGNRHNTYQLNEYGDDRSREDGARYGMDGNWSNNENRPSAEPHQPPADTSGDSNLTRAAQLISKNNPLFSGDNFRKLQENLKQIKQMNPPHGKSSCRANILTRLYLDREVALLLVKNDWVGAKECSRIRAAPRRRR